MISPETNSVALSLKYKKTIILNDTCVSLGKFRKMQNTMKFSIY